MITPVVMPQMGLEVTEGTVAAIHVAAGAEVVKDQVLLEVETDKAVTDVVAPRDGFVGAVEVEVGDTVPLGATLVVLTSEAGEAPVASAEPVALAVAEPAAVAVAEPAAVAAPASARTADGRLRAAPVARRAAARLGIAIERVEGTGPRGRITLRDVERVAAANGAGSAVATRVAPEPAHAADKRLEPLTAMRAAIARRTSLSQQIPQFALVREMDASWLLAQKAILATDAPVGINDMLLQAMAESLLRHPGVAASYVEATDDGRAQLLHREGVDVGLAVATERGLLVPVIRAAHARTLTEIAGERVRLVGAARSGRLAREDMAGASITLSNLSSFGIDSFTAMLNPGESAILAVGRVVERVVPRGRALEVVPTLTLSLTIDHRVADGATGAAALVELVVLLEGGMTWRP